MSYRVAAVDSNTLIALECPPHLSSPAPTPQNPQLPEADSVLRQAAIAKGVFVCLATGKARPAAIRALTKVGLAGERLHQSICCSMCLTRRKRIISPDGPVAGQAKFVKKVHSAILSRALPRGSFTLLPTGEPWPHGTFCPAAGKEQAWPSRYRDMDCIGWLSAHVHGHSPCYEILCDDDDKIFGFILDEPPAAWCGWP